MKEHPILNSFLELEKRDQERLLDGHSLASYLIKHPVSSVTEFFSSKGFDLDQIPFPDLPSTISAGDIHAIWRDRSLAADLIEDLRGWVDSELHFLKGPACIAVSEAIDAKLAARFCQKDHTCHRIDVINGHVSANTIKPHVGKVKFTKEYPKNRARAALLYLYIYKSQFDHVQAMSGPLRFPSFIKPVMEPFTKALAYYSSQNFSAAEAVQVVRTVFCDH